MYCGWSSYRGFCARAIQHNLASMTPAQLVHVLSSAPVGVAADVLSEFARRQEDGIALPPKDMLQVVHVCGKLKVYDSELFRVFEGNIGVVPADMGLRLLKAVVKLENASLFRDTIFACMQLHMEQLALLPVSKSSIPVLEWAVLVAKSNKDDDDYKILQTTLELIQAGIGSKVCKLKGDKDLLVQRSLVCSDEVFRLLVALGRLLRNATNANEYITDSLRSDLVFLCSSVLSYDLRNLDLDQLFKLYFSIYELGLFDDFFVRRRLFPAVVASIPDDRNISPKQTLLLATMVAQLPFKNPMVTDLVNILTTRAAEPGIKESDVGKSIERILKQISHS